MSESSAPAACPTATPTPSNCCPWPACRAAPTPPPQVVAAAVRLLRITGIPPARCARLCGSRRPVGGTVDSRPPPGAPPWTPRLHYDYSRRRVTRPTNRRRPGWDSRSQIWRPPGYQHTGRTWRPTRGRFRSGSSGARRSTRLVSPGDPCRGWGCGRNCRAVLMARAGAGCVVMVPTEDFRQRQLRDWPVLRA